MLVVDHLVGDGVVKNPAGRANHEVILKGGIRHHRAETVDPRTTFECGQIQRVLESHHAGFLFHRRIHDHGAACGFREAHATVMRGGMTGGRADPEDEGGQEKQDRQSGQVEPVSPVKPCIQVENHVRLRCTGFRLRRCRARC